ncbi:hypothetical protein AB4851_32365 [Burkholderia sp. 22PA0099]|uniref:hypothetical protein n=1 Tax=Burkholderia sp. 22PA0099 TaxID=3237372 RepID=UPI0039C1B594
MGGRWFIGSRSDAGGAKKPPGSPAVFSGIRFALYALSLLSIRQRSEIPKKVKIKLGGHGVFDVLSSRGLQLYTRAARDVQAWAVKNADDPREIKN